MKASTSLALIVCWVASALPVTTQAQDERPRVMELRGSAASPGFLARAMTREAVLLAAEDLAPSAVEGLRLGGKSRQSDWSRVRGLEGEEIILTIDGAPPGKRTVVRGTVNDVGLTVLNLTDPAIPAAVTTVLADGLCLMSQGMIHTRNRWPSAHSSRNRLRTPWKRSHSRTNPSCQYLSPERGTSSFEVQRAQHAVPTKCSIRHVI